MILGHYTCIYITDIKIVKNSDMLGVQSKVWKFGPITWINSMLCGLNQRHHIDRI